MTERAFYLVGDGYAMFSSHHVPTTTDVSRHAVLLLPPFGWDEIATHRARREWAIDLARRGHHVLRFDLPGTGDSAGNLDEPGLWDRWTAASRAACAWLRAESGAARVAAVGIGLGGYLAFDAAAVGLADDLVLWGTPAVGRRYLRELGAFAKLLESRIRESGGPPSPERVPGLEAGGFVLSEEMTAGVEALDLTSRPLPKDARVLLLDRDGSSLDGPLGDALDGHGVDVTTAHGHGFAAMVLQPDQSRPPLETFSVVAAWLDGGEATQDRSATEVTVSVSDVLDLGELHEEPYTLERPEGCLRGVLGTPTDDGGTGLALVFLNAGAIRRTGPNRLWATAARRWGRRGLPSLRLDLEGIGDADGDGEAYREVGRFHEPRLIDQVRAALDDLERTGVASRFLLIGLCSGGYWAFQTALQDARVAAAIMINPKVVYYHRHLDAMRDLRRTRLLVRPVTWKRLARGDVPFRRWRGFARWAAAHGAERLRLRAQAQEPRVLEWQTRRVTEGFTLLRDHGRRAHFIFCDGEDLRDELTNAGLFDEQGRWPNVSRTIVPGRDHTLKPVWMHPHVLRALDDAVERELDAADVSAQSAEGRVS